MACSTSLSMIFASNSREESLAEKIQKTFLVKILISFNVTNSSFEDMIMGEVESFVISWERRRVLFKVLDCSLFQLWVFYERWLQEKNLNMMITSTKFVHGCASWVMSSCVKLCHVVLSFVMLCHVLSSCVKFCHKEPKWAERSKNELKGAKSSQKEQKGANRSQQELKEGSLGSQRL